MSINKDEGIKRAAELLKQGATMLDMSCPIDGMPLFRLRSGEIVCPIHGKVYVIENESQMRQIQTQSTLERAEEVVVKSISVMTDKLKEDPSDSDAAVQLIRLLDVLERIRKLRGVTQQEK